MDRTYAYYNFISDVNLQRRESGSNCCWEPTLMLMCVRTHMHFECVAALMSMHIYFPQRPFQHDVFFFQM
jgi:hypothetical protein